MNLNSKPRTIYRNSYNSVYLRLSYLQNATGTFIVLVFLLCFLYVASQMENGRDYGEYSKLFDFLRNENFSNIGEVRYETGFLIIAQVFAKIFSDNLIVYILLAFSALVLKLRALLKSSLKGFGFFLILAFYVARYFPLLEFTQLRASIGAAFILLAFMRKADFGKDVIGFVFLGLAISFHYSSLIFVPFFLINSVSKYLLAVILVFSVTFFAGLKNVIFEMLSNVFPVFYIYNEVGYGEIVASRLSIGLILDLLFVASAIYFWKHASDLMKLSILGIVCGIGAYWSLLAEPILAHRLRELSSIFILIYMIAAFRNKQQQIKSFCSFFVIISIPYHMYFYIFYNPIFVSANQQ